MRRVLFVTYYFPPIGGIGSIRAARFASQLPEFGWEPLVLAPRDTPHPSDPQLEFPEEQVLRSRSMEISRLGAALRTSDGAGMTAAPPSRSKMNSAARAFFFFPDGQIGWFPGAVLAGSRALRDSRFDLVYSSSSPITGHLIAATLSRRVGLPWVAEFRDPWSDFIAAGPLRRPGRALEAGIARRADRVVMPTPTWATHFGERWQTDIAVVPNGHDGAPFDVRPDGEKVITHLGSFYPHRQNLSALWEALGRLEQEGAAPRVRFIGELHASVRAEASALGVDHLVEATGLLPHPEAIRLTQRSSALFVSGVEGSDPIARGCIPSKLFEYLATGLPILYLGDPEGDAARLLADRPGCYVLAPADTDAAELALREALSGGVYPRDVDELSRRARAQALAGVFDEAATGNSLRWRNQRRD